MKKHCCYKFKDCFPVGTKCLFFQASAPIGWIKDATVSSSTKQPIILCTKIERE